MRIIVLLVLLTLSILFFSRDLSSDFNFQTQWSIIIDQENSGASANYISQGVDDGSRIPFAGKDHFGYSSSEGVIFFRRRRQENLLLTDTYFTTFNSDHGYLEFFNNNGEYIFRVDSSWFPVAAGNRLFLIAPDQMAIAELNQTDGSQLWRQNFSRIITAFDANNEQHIVGLLNGDIILYNDQNIPIHKRVLPDSGYNCVYAAALAENKRGFAFVADLEPQKFFLYQISENEVQLVYSREIEPAGITPVLLSFVGSGNQVIYESGAGNIETFDLISRNSHNFLIKGNVLNYFVFRDRESGWMLSGNDSGYELTFFDLSYNSRQSLPFGGELYFTYGNEKGDIYLTIDNKMLKFARGQINDQT